MLIVDEHVATIGDRQQQFLAEVDVTEVERVNVGSEIKPNMRAASCGSIFICDSSVSSEVRAPSAALDYDAFVRGVVQTVCRGDRPS
jgi:hypothetical protein